MKLDHLIWPKIGWGYMPNNESVFNIFQYIHETINPKTWLEIGFHLGHSTTYTLEIMPEVKVTSLGVTKCRNANRYEIGNNMKSIYGDRFEYFLGNPPNIDELLKNRTFDIAFIDGDHKYKSVVNDITACMEMKISYILIDNCELEQVNFACEKILGIYKYDKFLYDSYWNGHKILEARLYHVQYNDLQEYV
jgi:hypothetical protein